MVDKAENDKVWKGKVIAKLDFIKETLDGFSSKLDEQIQRYDHHLEDCSMNRAHINQKATQQDGCLRILSQKQESMARSMGRAYRFIIGVLILIAASLVVENLLKR